jgi:hypothetical protein
VPELVVPIRNRGVLVKILVRERCELPTAREDHHHLGAVTGPLLAYLDTGASDTVLDIGTVECLGLHPVREAALHVLGREGVSFHDAYEVEVAVVLPSAPLRWHALTVLAGAVYQTGAVAALGRDFLGRVAFSYDGPKRQVRLHW